MHNEVETCVEILQSVEMISLDMLRIMWTIQLCPKGELLPSTVSYDVDLSLVKFVSLPIRVFAISLQI